MSSRSNTKSTVNKLSKEKLIAVRYNLMYGLSVEKYKSDSLSVNRGIVSTPNVIFYSSNNKCLFDYSNQTNKDIEEKVNNYFQQIPYGTTLTLYNAYYEDPTSTEIADISGTYTFKGFQNGIVQTDVVSVTNLSANINRYDKTKFSQIPYMSSASIESSEEKTIIKNRFGNNTKNSFNYLGAKVGDYIKYPAIDRPVKILSIELDSDGNEFIEVDSNLSVANYVDTATMITLYITVIDPIEPIDIEENEVGSCIEYFGNVIVSCTDNHTLSQCRARASKAKGIVSEITLGTFCRTPETDTAVQKDTTDNLVQITNALVNTMATLSTDTTKRVGFRGRNF